MRIRQENLVKELAIINQLLSEAYSENKEWRERHLHMATSRIGTIYTLLKEEETNLEG